MIDAQLTSLRKLLIDQAAELLEAPCGNLSPVDEECRSALDTESLSLCELLIDLVGKPLVADALLELGCIELEIGGDRDHRLDLNIALVGEKPVVELLEFPLLICAE